MVFGRSFGLIFLPAIHSDEIQLPLVIIKYFFPPPTWYTNLVFSLRWGLVKATDFSPKETFGYHYLKVVDNILQKQFRIVAFYRLAPTDNITESKTSDCADLVFEFMSLRTHSTNDSSVQAAILKYPKNELMYPGLRSVLFVIKDGTQSKTHCWL